MTDLEKLEQRIRSRTFFAACVIIVMQTGLILSMSASFISQRILIDKLLISSTDRVCKP